MVKGSDRKITLVLIWKGPHMETTSASPAEFVLIDIPANIGSIIKQRKRGN